MSSSARILLISNSTIHGRGYLDHVEAQITQFLGGARNVLFFPFALYDRDSYAAKATARFAEIGYRMTSSHSASDPRAAIAATDAIFIGGGNPFRLLKALQDLDLIEPIRKRIRSGAPYVGSSAGSNVAGPTIKTTKDMPIVQPRSFDALGLVPFQISPHFQDPDPNSKHMGETQEERIIQFLEENQTPVLGLREGSFIRQIENVADLKGPHTARVFRRDFPPIEVASGTDLMRFMGA